jgi:hypothetical protein
MTTSKNSPLTKLALPGMLQHLNDLYYPPNGNIDLEFYYRALHECRARMRFAFPGLTIILAEVCDSDYAPSMTHVLAPEPAETEHRIGWHDTLLARLSLDDRRTTLSKIATLEVKQEDGSWLSGTVEASGPAGQCYILTSSDGLQRVLNRGDMVRHIVFRDTHAHG